MPTMRQQQLEPTHEMQLAHEPRLELSSEPSRPRRTASWAPVAVDTLEPATTERRVLGVPYVPAPRTMTPRPSAYREEREWPAKRPKIAYQPEPQDKVIPCPQPQAHRVEQQQPRPPANRTPEEAPKERETLTEQLQRVQSRPEEVHSGCEAWTERLKRAQSCPAKMGTYRKKVRNMAVQAD